ncbi:MAG: O-antigen ligase family protein [Clostridia bacterium]|nr:O-antigen ligase family protein [Clostridia bacterium]
MENKNLKPQGQVSRSKFDRASSWLLAKIKGSFIGKLLTSYDGMNGKFTEKMKAKKKPDGLMKNRFAAKRKISRVFEHSFFVNKIPVLMNHLLRTSVRDYGVALLTMGFLMSILYPIQSFIDFLTVPFPTLIMGVVICICAIPLLFSADSLAHCVLECKPLSYVLFKWIGLKKDRLRAAQEQNTHTYPNIFFFFGLIMGILSHVIGAKSIILIAVVAALAYMVLSAPETGIVTILFLLPFISISNLIILTIYVDICYIIKYLVGKRTFKFELFDVFILGILILLVYGYAVSANIREAYIPTLINAALVLCYFAISNLIRSKDHYKRCINALTSSVAITCVIGILQFVFGKLHITWQGIEAFANIKERITSTFYDPDVFSIYICVSVPFVLLSIFSGNKISHRIYGLLTLALAGTCIVMAQSRGALIALIAEIILFLIIYNRNFIYLALAVVSVIPILYYSLPKNMLDLILGFGGSATGNLTKKELAELSFEIFKSRPFGMGIGEDNLLEMCKRLNIEGSVSDLDNLYLQFLCYFGIIGLIITVALSIMFLVLTLSFISKAKNKYRRINGSAGFVSFVGILVAGIFCYSLKSSELMFIAFVAIGLSMSYYKIERELDKPKQIYFDITTASVDIQIPSELIKNTTPKRKYVRAPLRKFKAQPKKSPLEELMNSNEFIRVIDDSQEIPIDDEQD